MVLLAAGMKLIGMTSDAFSFLTVAHPSWDVGLFTLGLTFVINGKAFMT